MATYADPMSALMIPPAQLSAASAYRQPLGYGQGLSYGQAYGQNFAAATKQPYPVSTAVGTNGTATGVSPLTLPLAGANTLTGGPTSGALLATGMTTNRIIAFVAIALIVLALFALLVWAFFRSGTVDPSSLYSYPSSTDVPLSEGHDTGTPLSPLLDYAPVPPPATGNPTVTNEVGYWDQTKSPVAATPAPVATTLRRRPPRLVPGGAPLPRASTDFLAQTGGASAGVTTPPTAEDFALLAEADEVPIADVETATAAAVTQVVAQAMALVREATAPQNGTTVPPARQTVPAEAESPRNNSLFETLVPTALAPPSPVAPALVAAVRAGWTVPPPAPGTPSDTVTGTAGSTSAWGAPLNNWTQSGTPVRAAEMGSSAISDTSFTQQHLSAWPSATESPKP